MREVDALAGEFLKQPIGEPPSNAMNLNLLWRGGRHSNFWLMDNHLAAAWCWAQTIQPDQSYRVLHIDAHYDARPSLIERWLSKPPTLSGLSLDAYLELTVEDGRETLPAVRWDNYIDVFMQFHGCQIERLFSATHSLGVPFSMGNWEEIRVQALPRAMELLSEEGSPWIVNFDIDYLVARMGARLRPMFSGEYIQSLCEGIRHGLERGGVHVVTICLSPECAGGWAQAKDLAEEICSRSGLPFPRW